MSGASILLVEDDPEICELVAGTLRMEGYTIDAVHEGADLAERLAATRYDLVILDRTLPDGEGAELCRTLRATGNDVLVLMLTARDALEDKLEGLKAGADDYLTKPFSFAEMALRVETLLRRAGRGAVQEAVPLRIGPLMLDRSRKVAQVGDVPVRLTATEFALLSFLMDHADRPVSRHEILKGVWGYDFDPNTNVVEVYVSYLRRRLAAATDAVVLRNVRGFGYVLEGVDDAAA